MIDPGDRRAQVLPADPGDAFFRLQHAAEQLLGAENLMAAAEGMNGRENLIKGPHTKGHGIGVVDDPGIRGNIPDGFGNRDKHRNGPHGPHKAARTDCIPDRLKDPDPFGEVDVAFHFIKGAGQDGDDHEVRACQRFLQGRTDFIGPAGHRFRTGADFTADDPVAFRGFPVDVIQADRAAQIWIHGQVCHKAPGPPPGSPADIGDNQFLRVVHDAFLRSDKQSQAGHGIDEQEYGAIG